LDKLPPECRNEVYSYLDYSSLKDHKENEVVGESAFFVQANLHPDCVPTLFALEAASWFYNTTGLDINTNDPEDISKMYMRSNIGAYGILNPCNIRTITLYIGLPLWNDKFTADVARMRRRVNHCFTPVCSLGSKVETKFTFRLYFEETRDLRLQFHTNWHNYVSKWEFNELKSVVSELVARLQGMGIEAKVECARMPLSGHLGYLNLEFDTYQE
jgi:hypothetical protein